MFYNKFISMPYMFRAPCAHYQEVKLVLYSLWYHQNSIWPSRAWDSQIEVRKADNLTTILCRCHEIWEP